MSTTVTDQINGVTINETLKAPVITVASSNVTLSGEQTINSVALVEGDRVLLIAQTDGTENGIYDVSTGTWQRSADFDGNRDVVQGCLIPVNNDGAGGTLYEVITDDPIVIGTTEIEIEQRYGANATYDRTSIEISLGITPTNTAYSGGHADRIYNIKRYGASTSASAATNSTAIQAASLVAWTAGGGYVYVPEGTFNVDTPPIIYETVSLIGAGKTTSYLKKTTATTSTVSDSTTRAWDSASVGSPICVVHFVAHDGTGNWSYAECRDIGVLADTSSPNTATTVYGFFFRGATGCKVSNCWARYMQVGFFFGGGATITSEISGNVAADVQRGFYQHFMTSTAYHHNYAVKFRYAGHYLSWYYSDIFSNAADNPSYPWKVGTTEISVAYQGNSCRGGGFYGNGVETHNGSCYKFSNCVSVRFVNNLALDIISDYTGGSDICLWENDSNNSCVYEDNRLQTTSVTGTAGRHFMYKITSELGNYSWTRNRFVASITDTTNSSTWANTSGTIQDEYEEGSYTGTFDGVTTVVTGTVRYVRYRNLVTLQIPTLTGTSNATTATITGTVPSSILPARQQRDTCRVQDNGTVNEGSVIVETSGTLTLSYGPTEAAFTNSGTKAVFYQTIAYSLT